MANAELSGDGARCRAEGTCIECQRLLERLVSAARISARRGFTAFREKQVGRADPQGRSTLRYRRAQRGGNDN